ncbi:MAG TPA: NADH-quinone oxidoreductase subunit H [Candidatus Bathyarchaeota archaeon]|nr:NADH-quinone oxidoreductase subunit H [Candidatus Bathyarchaeota archaeon]
MRMGGDGELADPIISLIQILIFPGLIFLFILGLIFEWIDRKAFARFQNRIGPLYTGPRGFLQPLADFIKLLTKEDVTPRYVDKFLFNLLPGIAPVLPVFASFYLPLNGYPILHPFEGDLILIITLMTIYTITVFMAGWVSTNRFSSIGAARAILQFLGFEIPMFISLASVAIDSASLSITYIADHQPIPYILLQPLGFIIFLIALQAELERVPFDIPEAESEIVAGWLTEYSGPKLAFFRLSNNLMLVFGAGLTTAIFLGGGSGPILPPIIWYLIKMVFVVILSTILRTIFARLRIDQVLSGAWRYLIPLAILQLILAKFLAVLVM